MPENSTSEDIYELVDTLPMPAPAQRGGRGGQASVASGATDPGPGHSQRSLAGSGTLVTPSGRVNKLPLPPRGQQRAGAGLAAPRPPPRYRSKIKIVF